jgi:hypothetical protein
MGRVPAGQVIRQADRARRIVQAVVGLIARRVATLIGPMDARDMTLSEPSLLGQAGAASAAESLCVAAEAGQHSRHP